VETVLHCHCGYVARAKDAEGLVAEVRRHAREAHGMALTDDEALLLAFRAQLDAEAPTAIPRQSAHSDEEER
jgi:hypothetical protein